MTKLLAIPTRAASSQEYWTVRLRQWLLEQSEQTRRSYAGELRDFAAWAGFGDHPKPVPAALAMLFVGEPEEVAARVQEAVLGYLEDLHTRPVWDSYHARDRGEPPVRHGLASATIQRRLMALRGVVRLAQQARFCPREVQLPKAPKGTTMRDTRGMRRRNYLQLLETFDHAIETAPVGSQKRDLAIRDRAIVRLLCECALRRTEVHRLHVEHLVWGESGLSVWVQRKGDTPDKPQLWPIASGPTEALREWLEVRGSAKGQIFTNRNGKPMKALHTINALVKKWGLESEIDEAVRPHKFRHTAVTELGRRTNGNITGMQAFAGHSDPKITMTYVHNEGDEIRALQELLGDGSEE